MVGKGVVLFRVQNFKECACRVATVADHKFVDLVEDENRIALLRFFHRLNNAAG